MRFRSGKVLQTDVKVRTKMADKERKWRIVGGAKLYVQLAIVLCCCVVNCVASQSSTNNNDNVNTLLDDNLVVPKSTAPVKKLWGLPDITATVGTLFRFHIPSDSFSGNVHHYELSEVDGPRLPSWLQFSDATSSLQGIPLENDRGRHFISVKAVAPPTDDGQKQFAQETFSIEVLPYWQDSGRMMAASDVIECEEGQPGTVMSLVVDADPAALGPNQRIDLVQKVAHQLAIDEKQLQMISFGLEEHTFDNFAIMAGPGNSRHKKTSGLLIRWQVGCGGKITDDRSDGVSTVERSSRDGTLANLLGFPIIGWHVTSRDPKRLRRDVGLRIHHTPVMGNVGPTKPPESTHLYEEYEDIDSTTDEDAEFPLSRSVPSMSSPTFTHLSTLATTTHKHRHHHQVHEGSARGRHHSGEHPDDYEGLVTATPTWKYHETPMPTPVLPVMPTVTDGVLVVVDTTTGPPETTVPPTEPPVDPRTTVTVHKNFHPVLINRVQKLAITAGKVYHFQIPSNTFFDFEDGETRKLTLTLLTDNSSALPPDSWIQFNQRKQEIYALPLEKNMGHWEFQLVAVDSDGETAKEVVEIHVRQDQAFRNINHEFIMHVKYDTHRFANVTWQIKLVEKLNEFFGDQTNLSILVRSVTPGHPTLFTWTANSLSVHYCPRNNITDLHKMMTTGKEENASLFFRDAGHPEYRVTKVQLKLFGMCKRKEVLQPHPNEGPRVINQIDRIDAYVGRMLRFQVPEDTFSDDEGTTSRLKLLLETMDGVPLTHTSWIMFNSYNNTHEFVGLPMDSDAGERDYKLIAMDKEGLRAMDALTVVVNKRNQTVLPPVITFSIHIDTDYDQFTRDTRKKIMVLDKLKYLYDDGDLRHITVTNITRGSVVFSWTNNSLPTDHCPKEEVAKLKSVIIDEHGNMTERLRKTFKLEFNISKVDAKPSAACQDEIQPTSVVVTPDPTAETEHATSEDDVYLTTVIPAVVIAAMLIIAAIIACVLYRKKRKGKLNVEEQSAFLNKGIPIIFADELDEKADPAKSPVIMKEEKPPLPPPEYPRSSGSSSPATPPMDRKGRDNNTLGSSSGNRRMDSDSGVGSSGAATNRPGMFPVPAQENSPLYQPPPPFTTNRDTRMNRPKHTSTPTYRMPPPYVPP